MTPRLVHEGLERGGFEAALEEQAAGALAQRLQQAVERGLAQAAVGGGALVAAAQTGRSGRRARSCRNGRWRPRRSAASAPAGGDEDAVVADEFHVRPQFLEAHGGGLDGAGEVLADAPEILPGQRADFGRGLLRAEAQRQVAQRHAPVPRIQPVGQRRRRSAPAAPPSVSGSACRQRHQRARQASRGACPSLSGSRSCARNPGSRRRR